MRHVLQRYVEPRVLGHQLGVAHVQRGQRPLRALARLHGLIEIAFRRFERLGIVGRVGGVGEDLPGLLRGEGEKEGHTGQGDDLLHLGADNDRVGGQEVCVVMGYCGGAVLEGGEEDNQAPADHGRRAGEDNGTRVGLEGSKRDQDEQKRQ